MVYKQKRFSSIGTDLQHFDRSGVLITKDSLSLNTQQEIEDIAGRIKKQLSNKILSSRSRLTFSSGLAVLIEGSSSRGKTLAAEVLSTALGRTLYKVDLGVVVSKYIGETEKNLAKLFSRAEGSDVVLLFDEGDSLFGTRADSNDDHDRYTNQMINSLLERLEAYKGLIILTTNNKEDLADAFLRRMQYVITVQSSDDE